MTDVPKTGDSDIADDIYDALVPLDGWPKGTRGGPRPYQLEHENGHRYILVVGLSDFGDVLVGPVMATNDD